jgi:hypothetical protein
VAIEGGRKGGRTAKTNDEERIWERREWVDGSSGGGDNGSQTGKRE